MSQSLPARVAIDGRVIADRFPGIGRYVYELVDALGAQGQDPAISLVVRRDRRGGRFDVDHLARWPSVRLVAVDRGPFDPLAQWEMRRVLRALDIDVFHATYWLTPYWPGVPTVLTLYDILGLIVPGAVATAERLVLRVAVRLAMRPARRIIAISEAAKTDIVRYYQVPGERVAVTHLAAGPAFHPADAEAIDALRGHLALPGRYVLYVGSDKPHKNLGLLVDAWTRLAAARTELEAPRNSALVIAGAWDPRQTSLRARTAALPPGRLRLLGPVPESDLAALYSGARAFAFPSRYEGFGLPVLEAMACGAPVVAADCSSLPEVVADAGLLVAPDDVLAWSAALHRLLTDDALVADLRQRGVRRAAEFSWREAARRTRAIYRAAATDPARPSA